MGWHDLVRRGGPIVANPISPGVARRRRLGPLRAKAAWVPFVRCHPCNEWAAPVVPRCVEPFAVSRVLTAYSSVLPCHALPPPRLALLCNDWIWTAVVPGRMDDGWMDGWMDREPLASLRHPACRPGTSLHAWAPDLLFGLLGAVVDVPARCERQRSCHVLSMRDRVLIPRSGADCPGASAGAHLHQLRGSPPPVVCWPDPVLASPGHPLCRRRCRIPGSQNPRPPTDTSPCGLEEGEETTTNLVARPALACPVGASNSYQNEAAWKRNDIPPARVTSSNIRVASPSAARAHPGRRPCHAMPGSRLSLASFCMSLVSSTISPRAAWRGGPSPQ